MFTQLETIGKWLILAGLSIAIIGAIIWAIARLTGWENLPGTLRFQTGGLTCIIPILGSIVLSIILTIVLNLLVRFLNR